MDVLPNFGKNKFCNSPHIVILGAGASLAAFPNGDVNGKKLPLMNSLVSTLGLTDILSKDYKPLLNDFERLYSVIYEDNTKLSLKKLIDEKVYEYFYTMQISEAPSVYDYLLLSLREKDIIVTFNWDPLLLQSARRHSRFQKHLPQILFLHGNVAVGICKHCNIMGYKYNKTCHHCNKNFSRMPLLYPVANKNYSRNKYIKGQWDYLQHILEYAYYITIFGYGAPSSDADAKNLMLNALKRNKSRAFSEVDIIDVKSDDEIRETWKEFFYSHHYGIDTNLGENYLHYHPRRSCDALASATLMNDPFDDNPFPIFDTIGEMHDWVDVLIQEEIKNNE